MLISAGLASLLPAFPQPVPGPLHILIGLAAAVAALAASARPEPHSNETPDLAALRLIGSAFNRWPDLGRNIALALEETLRVTKAQAGAIRLHPTPHAPSFGTYRGFDEASISLMDDAQSEGFYGRELPEDRVLPAEDLPPGPARDVARCLMDGGFHRIALCPLRFAGRILGEIVLADRRPGPAFRSHEPFLLALSYLLGVAISNARLQEQTAKLSEDLVALHEVNKIISQSPDLDGIIRRIVVEGRRLVKTPQCHLFLMDERQQRLVGSASTQGDGLEIRSVEIRQGEDSVAVRALQQKRVIAVEDIPRLEPFNRSVMETMKWRAAIFAPLIAKEQAIGILIFSDDAAERAFPAEQISRAETLAHQAAIALENARLFQVVSRSQKEWETTFDAMQDCVSVHDTSGKIIRANAALARRLKTTPQKMIGKLCAEIYNPAQLTFSPCRHMDGAPSENVVVEELELPAMGGTFQILVNPWYDKNNRLVGSIHVAKDISNEKLLRQQLIQSEKLSAIGELISGIAHELNNPLTGVMGYSQLLQLRKDLDDRARENLLKINNLALRCQKIVQNLLSFARKQKPERTLANVNEMLERTVELRNYELSVNNIEIVRELDRSLPQTIADVHQLQQVFLNIITNAEHAMLQAHGRGSLVIRSKTDAQNGRIRVEIADDGPGIQVAHLSKIFDPFFTTKEVGKGTGLGLSLSYGIIKEHGGNIYALSRPGEGATFVIELPVIARLADDASIFPELMPKAHPFDSIIRNKRVLIVDDEKYILDFFIEIFRGFPAEVDTAGDGWAAMEKVSRTDYDLVITDFRMPQMSGQELFEWIKKTRPQMAERIIFVTGDTVSAETRSFFQNTSNRYLAKPFKIEEVKEVIQQTLEARDR